jgi:hypothetical protein
MDVFSNALQVLVMDLRGSRLGKGYEGKANVWAAINVSSKQFTKELII